jgi:hypothetical protein
MEDFKDQLRNVHETDSVEDFVTMYAEAASGLTNEELEWDSPTGREFRAALFGTKAYWKAVKQLRKTGDFAELFGKNFPKIQKE